MKHINANNIVKDYCEETGKVRYTTKNDARQASKTLNAITAYKCEHCYGWHITTHRDKFFDGHLPSVTKRIERSRHSGNNYIIRQFDLEME
jgi:hypothetical protein